MKKKDLAPSLILGITCPTCGVGPGEQCVLHAGGPRTEAHVDRKLAAAEMIEEKEKADGS